MEPDDIEEPDGDPAVGYIRVPFLDGLSGQELLAHAVKVTPLTTVGAVKNVLFTVLGNKWEEKAPAAQWQVIDDHCASPGDGAE